MRLRTELYTRQAERWPRTGRHVLAQFDERTIVVYQAYRPDIGRFAAEHGYFGGDFSYSRMSWIKPNFLWMMYRCGWAAKEGQEVVLAVRLRREAFDEILGRAVPATFDPHAGGAFEQWKKAVEASDVRLQWDPDHGPQGQPLERRAIQLGLRGKTLESYGREWIVDIEDVTPFVREQRAAMQTADGTELVTPAEDVYPVTDAGLRARLGLDSVKGG